LYLNFAICSLLFEFALSSFESVFVEATSSFKISLQSGIIIQEKKGKIVVSKRNYRRDDEMTEQGSYFFLSFFYFVKALACNPTYPYRRTGRVYGIAEESLNKRKMKKVRLSCNEPTRALKRIVDSLTGIK
jgi:hypothetical protein